MASFRDTLSRLFSRNVILKRLPGNRLKAFDVSRTQSSGAESMKYDRYGWGWAKNTVSVTGWGTGYSTPEIESQRRHMYDDYEGMDLDGIIGSAIDIYADEATVKDADGTLLKINSHNPQIKKILYNLFYDVLNINTNLWYWVRSACKYGDFVLYLELREGVGISNVIPLHPAALERQEGFDPNDPNKFRFKYTGETHHNLGEFIEQYEVAHFRLLTDSNYLPYGKSILESARRDYKKLTLLEDAMLLHRIMRAPERRVFKVDIGNIAPEEVDGFMEDFANTMKKEPYIDPETGEYNLKFNLQNMLEDYFLPVRGSDTGMDISPLQGMANEGQIEDVEYVKNKLLAALKIPKPWLGFDENVEGKATMAAMDIRFARTIERVQDFVVGELYKMAVVHLYVQGFSSEDILDFELKLSNPSTIYKRQQLDQLNEKMNLATNMYESKLFSRRFIYERVFDLTGDEWKPMSDEIIEDLKEEFRKEQISSEGNDPKVTGKSFGTPHDLMVMQKASALEGEDVKNLYTQDERENNEGRPPKQGSFGRDKDKAFGRDPDGRKSFDQSGNPNLQAHYQRAKDTIKDLAVKQSMLLTEEESKRKSIKMLDENSLLDPEEDGEE